MGRGGRPLRRIKQRHPAQPISAGQPRRDYKTVVATCGHVRRRGHHGEALLTQLERHAGRSCATDLCGAVQEDQVECVGVHAEIDPRRVLALTQIDGNALRIECCAAVETLFRVGSGGNGFWPGAVEVFHARVARLG